MAQVDYATAAYEFASPTLLAKQPANPPTGAPGRISRGWDTIYAHLEARMLALRNWRYSWWAFWSILAAFFLPFRYVWLVTANRMWRGGNINTQIINSHGLLAVRTCAAGMWTGLCSPSRPWFKVGIALPWIDIAADAKDWLTDTEQKIYTVFAQSNFYSIMAQAFRDLVVIGTAPPIIYEDAQDVIRLYLPCAGEYYLGLGARFDVTEHYSEFTMTVSAIVGMFTIENCPEVVRRNWAAGQYETEHVIARAIEPNFDLPNRAGGSVKVIPGKFTWREVYWLKGTKTEKPLSVRGFRAIRPFMALRWSHVSNDAYGRSPCMDAIGDNRQLQTEDMRKGEFIEKGIRPPMGAEPELKNEPASIMPGMITYMNTAGQKKGFWPLFEVAAQWLTGLTADITKIEGRIDHCLFVDLFMAISRMEGVQPRNELELTKRDLERLQELGPVITLAENEFDLAIERTMEILERRGMLKPRPQSLRGVPLKITYVSILRLAQRSAESIAMKDVFATAGALSSAAKAAGVPDPIRVINLDKSMKHYADLNNYPNDCVFTDDEIKEHDAIRQKAMQAAQAPQQAMAAVTAAKTLSDTQLPGGNSALGALVGQQPQGGA